MDLLHTLRLRNNLTDLLQIDLILLEEEKAERKKKKLHLPNRSENANGTSFCLFSCSSSCCASGGGRTLPLNAVGTPVKREEKRGK